MDKEEILNKYIDLIDKGYCSDCNELNCIDNFFHAKITHGIRELQQENKQLKEENMNLRNIKIYKQDDDLLICVGEDCKRFKLNTNELLWIKEKGDSNE